MHVRQHDKTLGKAHIASYFPCAMFILHFCPLSFLRNYITGLEGDCQINHPRRGQPASVGQKRQLSLSFFQGRWTQGRNPSFV